MAVWQFRIPYCGISYIGTLMIFDDWETNRSKPASTIVAAQSGLLTSSMKYAGIFVPESTFDKGGFPYNLPVRSRSSLSDFADY